MRHRRLPLHNNLRHHRHPDRQHRARAVAPIAGDDPSAQRFDKTAADRQAEPGAGAAAILRVNAIELVEDALEIGRRYPRPLVETD
jgi:hypothetical protein